MFNAAYSRLSEEERLILEAYHDKGIFLVSHPVSV